MRTAFEIPSSVINGILQTCWFLRDAPGSSPPPPRGHPPPVFREPVILLTLQPTWREILIGGGTGRGPAPSRTK